MIDLLRGTLRAARAAPDAAGLLERLAVLLVPAAADWCLADRLDEPDQVVRIAARGRDGALDLPLERGQEEARRSSARAGGGLELLRAAPQQLLHLSPDELTDVGASADPRLRGQIRLVQQLGTADLLVLGLTARSQLLGVLTLGRAAGRFTPDDVALLAELASVAAMALDNHRLLQVQRSFATALQRSLLPPLPAVSGVTLAARYVPAEKALDVGGDWYDAFVLPAGPLALVIGDATGHDVSAAVRMAEIRNMLRAAAVEGTATPGATLAQLDRIVDHLGSSSSATCLYGQLLPPAGTRGWRLRWSSAGHLPPVLLRDGEAVLLETGPDLMLGVDPASSRGDHERGLVVGDTLLLYTDGLVEERRASLDDGLRRLVTVAEGAATTHPEGLADHVVAELASREDDVAVLVVRIE